MTAGAEPRLSTTVTYRVRFDECTPAGTVRPSTLLRYAQDAAWIHSERLGFDRGWYATRGLTWLVRCADVHILALPAMGEIVSVTTSIVGYRKVWGRRRTDIVRADGSSAGVVQTDWVITDERGAPTRVPADFLALMGHGLPTFVPGRVTLPPAPGDATSLTFEVRDSDLDPMAHVNNAAYLDYVETGARRAPDGPRILGILPRRYRLEYVGPAPAGATVEARAWPIDAGLGFRLSDAAGRELLRATVEPEGRSASRLA